MKKLKRILAMIPAVAIGVSAVIGSSAASIFYSNGCYYTLLNNQQAALTGWDTDISTVVTVPGVLNGRAVTDIDSYAFYEDTAITGVDFSGATNLTTIGMYAFSNCSALSTPIVLPESVVEIDDCAFEGSAVTQVEFNGTANIPIQCCYGCGNLTEVRINGDVTAIGTYAFANCPNLTAVYLPESVTTIPNSAFKNDPNLTIYCYEDSYAQQYAEEKNIPYVLIRTYETGDVDRDGAVTVTDVTLIQKYLAELATLDAEQLLLADYLSDGEIDIADATAIQIAIAD